MHRSSLAAFAALTLFAATQTAGAQDVKPGAYKLTIGRAAPCVLTLAADGRASLSADCKDIKAASRWHISGKLLKLADDGNSTVALLKASGDGYSGTTIPDGVALLATP